MVSGGSDSVAMMLLIKQLLENKTQQNIKEYTHVLHINHHLRGEESEEDQNFVLKIAENIGICSTVIHKDIAKISLERKENIENIGREERYKEANKILDRLCQNTQTAPENGRIVTAHTLDDRAETFFMRAITGGGTAALASVPYKNKRVIRPLLDCTREELQDWLISSGQSWREDKSNQDEDYLRAFVRHRVVAECKKKNPSFLQNIRSSMDILASENDFISGLIAEKTAEYVVVDTLPPAPLATVCAALFFEHPAIVRRVLYWACNCVVPTNTRLTYDHIELLATNGLRTGFATDIPGNVTVRNVCGTLVIRQKKESELPRQQ
jgi:tRNA(Ile)-lysidine synthase